MLSFSVFTESADRMYADFVGGMTYAALAAKYGVSLTTAHRMVNAHIAATGLPTRAKQNDERGQIRYGKLAAGMSMYRIAKEEGVSLNAVRWSIMRFCVGAGLDLPPEAKARIARNAPKTRAG